MAYAYIAKILVRTDIIIHNIMAVWHPKDNLQWIIDKVKQFSEANIL